MMMGVGMIAMVAFWALLIWVVFALGTRESQRPAPDRDSALDILEQRFARGEMDRDEFDAKRRALQGN